MSVPYECHNCKELRARIRELEVKLEAEERKRKQADEILLRAALDVIGGPAPRTERTKDPTAEYLKWAADLSQTLEFWAGKI